MSAVFDLADRFVDAFAALHPVWATDAGVLGHDDRLTDYSPAGTEARSALLRATLAELDRTPVDGDRDRVAAGFLRDRLTSALDVADAGEHLRDLRVIASPVEGVRGTFDLMARDTADDWHRIATRATAVPAALASLLESLDEGVRRGVVAARRQALACADQAATWGGLGDDRPFFLTLADELQASAVGEGALASDLERGAHAATAAYAELSHYLRDTYAPAASDTDAVGPERYRLFAREFLGADIDLTEAYDWGWEELHRIEHDMAVTAERVLPGGGVAAAEELLETDPDRSIVGVEAFRAWLQDLMDRTIAELDGTHFDIAEPIRRVEAMISPPGGAAAMYYTAPSEDFSRPGRTWYPTQGRDRFPLWGEVSTAYHEGVPGHHLQIAQAVYRTELLSRFQRVSFVSGHGEGWALYAERLMDELGYLEDPGHRLGYLSAQAMRAVRVVVDLGMHLQLRIPDDERFHPGDLWTPELGRLFLLERAHQPPAFVESEWVRYLGWPAQAISYKLGERLWLRAREAAQARLGADFDLKAFHAHALDLGPLGLDQLAAELA